MNNSMKPSGGVIVVFIGVLLSLMTIIAFAVNFGYRYVVLNELQNSADAGAAAGAGVLVKAGVLDWIGAKGLAVDVAQKNKTSAETSPKTVMASAGYWYSGSEQLGGESIPANLLFAERQKYFPGVKVRVAREKATNNALSLFFSNLIGVDYINVGATAMAIISGPSYVDQRDLFPFVITKCMYEKYWDYTRSPPGPVLGSDGKAPLIRLPSTDANCPGDDMAWTGLGVGSNAAAVKAIVDRYKTQNPIASQQFGIGDKIPIFGSPSSPLKETAKCTKQPGGDGRCAEVTVVVVDNIPGSANGEEREIRAFSCLEVVFADHPKYVDVRMSNSCPPPPSSGGIGPIFGTVTPPALVQ